MCRCAADWLPDHQLHEFGAFDLQAIVDIRIFGSAASTQRRLA
jgi:hypothetical protein